MFIVIIIRSTYSSKTSLINRYYKCQKNAENCNVNLSICICTQLLLVCRLIAATLWVWIGASELRTVAMFVIVNTRIKRFYILCTYLYQLGYLPSQQILHTLLAQSTWEQGNFCRLKCLQTGPETYPASYSVTNRSLSLISISCWKLRTSKTVPPFPTYLHGLVLNEFIGSSSL